MARKRAASGQAAKPPAKTTLEASLPLDASALSIVAGLEGHDLNGLRRLWRAHLGGDLPAHLPRWLLMRLLAYRLQTDAFGGLDKSIQRMLRSDKDRDAAIPFDRRAPPARPAKALGIRDSPTRMGYAQAYPYSDRRTDELSHWLHRYNWHQVVRNDLDASFNVPSAALRVLTKRERGASSSSARGPGATRTRTPRPTSCARSARDRARLPLAQVAAGEDRPVAGHEPQRREHVVVEELRPGEAAPEPRARPLPADLRLQRPVLRVAPPRRRPG